MKNRDFTEIGYPAGNVLIRDHMRAMVKKGEKHEIIRKVNKSLRTIEKLIQGKPLSTYKPTKRYSSA